MADQYDFVIVGGGSAGSALANRLCADPGRRVLVLEAGRSDYRADVLIHMPAALTMPIGNRLYDWKYESEPEPAMNGRRIYHARGKVLGGSSSINGMIFQRGNPLDYERWAADPGLATWDYAHCLPYFKRMENSTAESTTADQPFRGHDGPLQLERGPAANPLFEAFFAAGAQAGFPRTSDVNGYQQEGFAQFDRNIRHGRRLSAARAYLHPVMARPNVDVRTGALVHRVLFDGNRAIGVEYTRGRGAPQRAFGGTVILCGGAFNTPQLLQLSGIGNASELRPLGIDMVGDLPGVGEHLQDHLEVYIQYACTQPVTMQRYLKRRYMPLIGAEWLFLHRGPGATNHFEGGGFVRSNDEVAYPNLMFHFLPIAVRYDGSAPQGGEGYQVHIGPMYSDARGSVKITSTDPRQHPALRFNYLSTDQDRREWVEAIRIARDILNQPAMAPFNGGEISPGPAVSTDDEILDWVRRDGETALHPSCTARMGVDQLSVTDPLTMGVHGVEGLCVVDASAMPYVTNGNIYAPVMMLAEKAADLILGNTPLAPEPVDFYRHQPGVTNPRVVIIGAGVVGAALADELTARDWTDVTLVDQGDLPAAGGSSSHAPGLVFQANSSKTMTEFARYTVEKLGGLDDPLAPGESCFRTVGGLEVATTPERVAELHRRHGWLTAWGVEAHVLDAAETVRRYPLLDPAIVLGGLYTPSDGLAKAVSAVDAQVRRSAARGARILPRHEVLDIVVDDGAVRAVMTDHGEIAADIVVCCAGIWGPKVAGLVGLPLPLTPLGHQLATTTALPALAGRSAEATLPILRHQDHDLYYRERFDTLVMGYYGHRPMPIDADEIASIAEAPVMPSVLEFTPADFAEAWTQTQRLLPATRGAEIASGFNGLFSFTTDNFPLIGESPDVRGFWVAEAVWVTHSAGVARAVAELLVDGHCASFDLHECDLNRFEAHQLAPDYVRTRDCQNFVEVYDIIHPLQPAENLRPMRTSPFYSREVDLGAVFLEASGWERPQWYEANAALVAGRRIVTPDDWAAHYWSPIVAAEAQVTREAVAMYDMTALKRLEVTGPGAVSFLQGLVTGDVAKSVGSVTYCLLLDVDGGIRSDVTVARLGRDRFQLGANGNLDLDWLMRRRPDDGSVHIADITPGTCCIGLWGPRARDVIQPLTSTDFSNVALKYFRARTAYLGSVPVTALRLSYVGELGWELYTTADHGARLWDLLMAAGREHGIIAAGRGAFTSLRLEKGYRSFGADMTFEHDPYEAGLGFAVKLDQGDFIGRDALLERKDEVTRKLTCLTLDDETAVVLGKEPVYSGDRCVGYVTSAAYGYTIGRGIAYAWLPASLAEVGTAVQIGYFDRRLAATVAAEPLVDAEMARIRA